MRTSVKAVVMWSAKSPMRRLDPGQIVQPPGHEGTERGPGDIDIGAVPVDEVHRHAVHQPLRITLEAEALLEHRRRDPRAVIVGVGPDLRAVAEKAVRPAEGEGGIGEQRGRQRLQRQRDPQLAQHIGLGGEVEIDLDGAGPRHHVEAQAADLRHVTAHDRVTTLRHPWHRLARHGRVKAERGEAERKRLGGGANGGEVGVELGACFVQRVHRRARQLQLAGRFERNRGALAQTQPDRVATIENRLPLGGKARQ